MERQICVVEESFAVNNHYRRVKFRAPQIAASARAGQFVHILPRDESSFSPFLRRAFSILTTTDGLVEVLFRIGGQGTQLLAHKRVGEEIDVLGPLGNSFPYRRGAIIVVGGGVGVPPLCFLARQESAAGRAREITAIVGGRSQADILCVEDFQRSGVEPIVVTNDGTAGIQGLVTEPLKELLLKQQRAKQQLSLANSAELSSPNPSDTEDLFHVKQTVYACGPLPMLAAVAQICHDAFTPCVVSLEENMPCGIGVCNGCVVPVNGVAAMYERSNQEGEKMGETIGAAGTTANAYEKFRRVCVEGPGMWTHEIDWKALCG